MRLAALSAALLSPTSSPLLLAQGDAGRAARLAFDRLKVLEGERIEVDGGNRSSRI